MTADPLTFDLYAKELILYSRKNFGWKYRRELLTLWRAIAADPTCEYRLAYRQAVQEIERVAKSCQ